jgi:hypothetical protein
MNFIGTNGAIDLSGQNILEIVRKSNGSTLYDP